jgi:tetraacyldisaccharide 4'-kinase
VSEWLARYQHIISGQARGVGPSLARLALWTASGPYAWVMRWRNRGYDAGRGVERVAVPVVSVGNLTLGGTGKTPCVEYVARTLSAQGLAVAIVSRGYGSTAGRNDEALVLEENVPDVPHLQGADRVAVARTCVEELESDLIVLDDGFQHRRLHRDLDIVLLDATNPWGFGHVCPRGLLREPRSGLRRAGLIVLTRCDQVSATALADLRQSVAGVAPVVETTHAPLELVQSPPGACADLGVIRNTPVAAFCGLGNPAAFRRTLADGGADVRRWREFPDHHAYTRADVLDLDRWAQALPANGLVLTTQKDLVKLRLPELGGRPLWAVRIGLAITQGAAEFAAALTRVTPG